MKIKFYSQLIISLFVFNASFAQSIFKGAITNFNTNAKTDFNFTLTFATIGTQYISTYKLIDIADGKQFASITVVNEKPTAKIKVQLIVNADTSRFEINYSDSLGRPLSPARPEHASRCHARAGLCPSELGDGTQNIG